ncbi:hypothetical protein CWI40_060980 [Ordospora colligata]|nr:hypothetical protein CWI40_060980 [Ordospora colligata]
MKLNKDDSDHKQFIRELLRINSIKRLYFNYDQFVDKSGKASDQESMKKWKEMLKSELKNENKNKNDEYFDHLLNDVLVIRSKKEKQSMSPEEQNTNKEIEEWIETMYTSQPKTDDLQNKIEELQKADANKKNPNCAILSQKRKDLKVLEFKKALKHHKLNTLHQIINSYRLIRSIERSISNVGQHENRLDEEVKNTEITNNTEWIKMLNLKKGNANRILDK